MAHALPPGMHFVFYDGCMRSSEHFAICLSLLCWQVISWNSLNEQFCRTKVMCCIEIGQEC